jgi:tetratricopeptide (TPR) repeat protein
LKVKRQLYSKQSLSFDRDSKIKWPLMIQIGLAAFALFVGLLAQAESAYLPKTNVAAKVAELDGQSAGLMSQATHKKMQRVHGYMQNKKYDNAISLLAKLEASAKSRPGELAQIYQTMGFSYIEMKNEKKAAQFFEKALALKFLPKGPSLSTMYMLAQLYASEEQYQKGEKMLLEWFASSEKPGGGAYALLANIYAQSKKKKAAFANIDKAISLEPTPSKAWLQLATALAFELKKYARAEIFLKLLTKRFPEDKSHWKQLAGVYIHLEKGKLALATLELAQKAGHLDKQADILHLVSLYLNRRIPYWAAMTMEDAFKKKNTRVDREKPLFAWSKLYAGRRETEGP